MFRIISSDKISIKAMFDFTLLALILPTRQHYFEPCAGS